MRTLSIGAAEVRVYPDTESLQRAAADEFIRAAQEAIGDHHHFAVAFCGGTTPRGIYARLATEHQQNPNKVPWPQIHVFFGDERNVPPSHAESNFRMTRETLLGQVPLPLSNIYRVRGELSARIAASDYENWLKSFFRLREGRLPRFDLILLGMGVDGHTASLFPDSAALHEQSRLVVANWVQKLECFRITFTFPVLNAAAQVVFVVAGPDKAQALRAVLGGDLAGQTYPAQAVQPTNGTLLWMVDEAAASLLE